jgi:hypothetical protein
MSALGQKQTFAPQKAMSALPPKADILECSYYSGAGAARRLIEGVESVNAECDPTYPELDRK